MITTLTDTTATAVDKQMSAMRETYGATTIGRVLTLVIVASGRDMDAPLAAAVHASHEHPCRVLVLDQDPHASNDGLDAEIRVGRDAGAGEIIILRVRGAATTALDTLIMPLLLPDAPIVTWWPHQAPSSPAQDVLGAMSARRITDVSTEEDPLASLKRLRRGYHRGDSDLAWSRLTRWRGLLASAIDGPHEDAPHAATVFGEDHDPSVLLLACWLRSTLNVNVQIKPGPDDAHGAGLHGVEIALAEGTINLQRAGEHDVQMTLPGDRSGTQSVNVPQRGLEELLTEELRRLDPDEVYGEVLAEAFAAIDDPADFAKNKPAPTTEIAADPSNVAQRAAAAAARQLARALKESDSAHLVLTGGGVGSATAAALPRALQAEHVDPTGLHVWWGDERFVPRGDEQRNDAGIEETCLEPLFEMGVPETSIHRIPGSHDGMSLQQAAAWYGQKLDSLGGDRPFRTRGQAFFDVLLLGVGPDAHVASLFPEHPGQQDTAGTAIAITDSPKPPSERISLSWPVVNSARHVILLATGAEKADAVAAAHGQIDPWRVPASAVRGLEATTWFIDEAAAAQLD